MLPVPAADEAARLEAGATDDAAVLLDIGVLEAEVPITPYGDGNAAH